MGVGWVVLQVALLAASCRSQETTTYSFFGEFVKLVESAIDLIFSPFYGRKTEDIVMYKGYQLFRVYPRTEDHVDELQDMLEDEEGVQFWTPPLKNHTTDVLLPPDMVDDVKGYLKEQGIEYTILISNLNKIINQQNPKDGKENKLKREHPLTWQKYHRYQDIMDYLSYLEENYPDIVEIKTIGTSAEGRSLKVIKISEPAKKSKEKKEKPAIWIDAGAHGREWITPAVALFLVKQLVQGYEGNKKLVNNMDWYIMPLVNPDGYEYTHTTDRFWRKNKSPSGASGTLRGILSRQARFFFSGGSRCYGVDLNRNWAFHWGEVGSSDNPCRETYAGIQPFSEPETRAVSNFIMDIKDQLKIYLTLHAYSQMWLIPWSYTRARVKDYDELMYMGRRAVNALQKMYGTEFHLGTSPSLLYPIAGSSDDWAKGKAGIKYSYTVELRDKGRYGFLLPSSQIIPTGRETFAAVKAMVKSIIDHVE
ncbi:carboxypeptidase B-like [Lycorma delicatula]|uniref:carboxypeptidase B-like n=1 Tax=Lycorma delicatula TaxID=130591 RepID=UPI003F50F7D4